MIITQNEKLIIQSIILILHDKICIKIIYTAFFQRIILIININEEYYRHQRVYNYVKDQKFMI